MSRELKVKLPINVYNELEDLHKRIRVSKDTIITTALRIWINTIKVNKMISLMRQVAILLLRLLSPGIYISKRIGEYDVSIRRFDHEVRIEIRRGNLSNIVNIFIEESPEGRDYVDREIRYEIPMLPDEFIRIINQVLE